MQPTLRRSGFRIFNPLAAAMLLIAASPIAFANWQQINLPTDTVFGRARDFSFPSSSVGYLLIDQSFSHTVYKTTNGGNTWSKIYFSDENLGPDFEPARLHFVSPTVGWLTPNSGFEAPLMRTTDGGTTWSVARQPFVQFGDDNANTIFFIDANTGYLKGEGLSSTPGIVAKTTDGGTTWTVQTTPFDGMQVGGIHFINASRGWMCGTNGTIMYTHNGGATWKISNAETSEHFSAIRFADANIGWAVSDAGTIVYSNDGGVHWYTQAKFEGVRFRDIAVFSTTRAVAVGDEGTGGIIYITSNGGATWLPDNVPVDTPLRAIERVGDNIYVGGGTAQGSTVVRIFRRSFQAGAAPFISTRSFLPGTRHVPYEARLAAVNGTAPYTWSLTSGTLPNGLTLSTGGIISGTPTVDGHFAFTVQFRDAQGRTDKRVRAIDVSSIPMAFKSTTLPDVFHRRPFEHALSLLGGHTPYRFTILSGSLPPGTSIKENGVLGGTPQTVGTYNFTLRVIDSGSLAQKGEASFTIKVVPLAAGLWEAMHAHNRVTDVHFFDENNAIAIGWSGIVLTTDNGGKTWKRNNRALAMYNFTWVGDEGWMVDNAGTWHSIDRGKNWTFQTQNFMTDIYFRDRLNGWSWGAGIYYTNNGGQTWHKASTPAGIHFWGLDFKDATTGFAGGEPSVALCRSTDGGKTWTSYSIPGLTGSVEAEVNSVDFINSQKGWIGTQVIGPGLTTTIFHTADGGQSWSKQLLTGSGTFWNFAWMPDGLTGWVAGLFSGSIRRTDNGGLSWKSIAYFNFISAHILSLKFINKDVGFATPNITGIIQNNLIIDTEGSIWKTINGGHEWSPVYCWPTLSPVANESASVTETYGPNLVDAFFLDATHGWALGRATGSSIPSRIYFTDNGGVHWKLLSTVFGLSRIEFVSPTRGFGFAGANDSASLYETNDGGKNWRPRTDLLLLTQAFGISGDMQFIDSQVGWFLVDEGSFNDRLLFRTNDSGTSWTKIWEAELGGDARIHFIDRNRGWMVDTTSNVRRTTNGGQTWENLGFLGAPLTTVYFVNAQNGWAAGKGKLFKTINGGDDWTPVTVNSEWDIKNIFFNTCTKGWLSGGTFAPIGNPLLLETTTNHFSSTTQVNLGIVNNNFQHIMSPDGINIWGAGNLGFFAKYSHATNALMITTTGVPNGRQGTAYSSQLARANASGATTWQICNGTLPSGITLNTNGLLSGTPTQAGTFKFTAAVTDAALNSSGKVFFMTIEPTVSPTINTATLPNGTVGVEYVTGLAASGTTPPYDWDLVGGQLPPGLTLLRYGTISGYPTAPGAYAFDVRATDSRQPAGSATKRLTITITGNFAPAYQTGVPGAELLYR